MVIDMPQVQSDGRQSKLMVGHPLLSKVRFGYHPDKLRLVLDLAQVRRTYHRFNRRPPGPDSGAEGGGVSH
jgi:hypothetical protein